MVRRGPQETLPRRSQSLGGRWRGQGVLLAAGHRQGAPRPEPFLGRERAEVSQAGAGWGRREPCSLTCSHQELKLLPLIAYVSEVSVNAPMTIISS